MQYKQYDNVIYGEYITYNVNNVYEAIYILKHHSRVRNYTSIEEDPLSKKYIEIYKQEFKKHNDLNDLFLKYKIQFIDKFTKNTTNVKQVYLYPNFSYIIFQNNKWSPVIFRNEQIHDFSKITLITQNQNSVPRQSDIIEQDNYIQNNLDNDIQNNLDNIPLKEPINSKYTQREKYSILKSYKDINLDLKKRLMKSYIKNNHKKVKQMLTYHI